MRDVAADLATILDALVPSLSFSSGGNLYAGPLPVTARDSKGAAVSVVYSTGEGAPHVGTGGDLWTADVEVTVRGARGDYRGASELALECFAAAHRALASPYVSILCDGAAPDWDGWDENNAPVFTFIVTMTYVTASSGAGLVVLPSGPLRVQAVEFPDGSSFTTADLPIPPPPDLTPYATKAGTETLTNKTLDAPVVTGPLMPATAGQQALGSAERPWGEAYLKGRDALSPVEIDNGSRTHVPAIRIRNQGQGSVGIRLDQTTGAANMALGAVTSNGPYYNQTTHKGQAFIVNNMGYDSLSPSAFRFYSQATPAKPVMHIGGSAGQTAPLTEWRTSAGDADPVAALHNDGTFETVAGVVLRSPSGTRYRITVADDGSLSTEPA